MHARYIIPILFFFTAGPAISQSSWRIDKLGTAEGLSEGIVYTIHQDKKGFIWVGTHGGLNRYDGYGFRVFQYRPFDARTLGDNAVFFLEEDSATGKFWIGGSSCLNEFDPETFTNTRYRYADRQLEFSDGVFINTHEMLLACEYDVLLFNTQKKLFTRVPVYNENNQPVSLSRVENTATDKRGNFMILSKTGIFFFDPVTKTCRRKTASAPDLSPFYYHEVFNVLEDGKGYYWIATNKKGLIRYNPQTKEAITFTPPEPANTAALRFDIVTEDVNGTIWAGCSRGLFRINPVTLSSEYFSADISKPVYLNHPEVNAIMEDRHHLMWIGTIGGGVNKMIPQNSGFKSLHIFTDDTQNKTGTYIMGLQPAEEDVWFINIWDQVGKVNTLTGKVTLLNKPELPNSYSWYSEGTILKTGNKSLLLLNGENEYRITQNRVGGFFIDEQTSPGLSYVHQSNNGKTYYMLKAETGETFCRNDTLFGNQFFYAAKDDNAGNIWIGSSKGLLKLNTHNNTVTQFRHDDKNNNTISADFIYALQIDNSYRNIWMAAYNGGLCSYNIASGKFRHYTKDDGLADNIVYSIEKDDHGNFWFSSNAGISTYETANNIFRNYGMADGLLNNEFNRRSSCKNDKGWMFFGGIFGIDYFHPDSISKDNSIAGLAFTNFRVFNKDFIPDSRQPVPVIELNHNDRYISIEFTALGYNDLQKVQYAYRLNNSSDWIKLGNQHTLAFSDLPTGSHRLFIRSTNLSGAWLDNSISCSIIIHPAWWQTWWARLLLAVILLGITVIPIRFYIQRKLEKQRAVLEKRQAIEKERTRIATDMHDDLGAGLSRIKFLSETIGLKKQQQLPVEEEITSIRNYSHEMIDKMGEIVWALNEKNDSLSDLITYLRGYAVQYLSENGLQCSVDVPEQFPQIFVSGEFRRNVYLTVKEALHNIIKHAQAKRVTIKIKTGTSLNIHISDDGTGFEEKTIRPFSNGITNMKKRVESLGGELQIINLNGTTISLSVPVP